MTHAKFDTKLSTVPQEKVEKLTKKIAKSLFLDLEVAAALIYKEWDTVEELFEKHKKVKAVHQHLLKEIAGNYRGSICND